MERPEQARCEGCTRPRCAGVDCDMDDIDRAIKDLGERMLPLERFFERCEREDAEGGPTAKDLIPTGGGGYWYRR